MIMLIVYIVDIVCIVDIVDSVDRVDSVHTCGYSATLINVLLYYVSGTLASPNYS